MNIKSLILSALCLLAASAFAQEATQKNPFGPWYLQDAQPKNWQFELALGFEQEPTHPGSSETEQELGGLLRIFAKDPWNNRYYLTPEGVGGVVDLRDDLAFSWEIEQEESDDSAGPESIPGLDQVEETWEGQFTLAKRWGDSYAFGTLQPDLLGRGKGLVWFAGAGYDRDVGERFSWFNRVNLSGGDGTHMDTEFDITAAESERTGFDVYDPGAGLKNLAWVTTAEYRFNDRFSLFAKMDTELFLGDAADSPIVKDGSDVTTEILSGIFFRW